MKIKLDDRHTLVSDQYCCWVEQTRTTKAGRTYQVRVSGYYRTINDALSSYINKRVLSSEAESLRALDEEIEALKTEVRAMCFAIKGGKK